MKKTGLYRFAQAVVPPLFKLLYRCEITGQENIPNEGPVILCSNHTCYKDPLFMGLTQKRQVCFMAKQELFKNRFLAWLFGKLGVFPVERAGGVSAIKRGIHILKENGTVGIFIEGHRSKTGEPQKPKPGAMLLAFETNATVVPMAITGMDGKPPKFLSKTYIHVGEAIPFSQLEMADSSSLQMRKAIRLVMDRIIRLRAEALGIEA